MTDFPEFNEAYNTILIKDPTDKFERLAADANFNVYHSDIWRGTGRKFAEAIVRECVACCGSQADKNNLLRHFGIPVESNIQYESPPVHNSVTSQYTRKYNIPKE